MCKTNNKTVDLILNMLISYVIQILIERNLEVTLVKMAE